MKKLVKVTAMMAALAMVLMMAGCGKKTYTSVEDWYTNDTVAKTFVSAMVESQSNEDADVSIDVEDNCMYFDFACKEKLFGIDPETDKIIEQAMYESLGAESESYEELIGEIAELTGIDASEISIGYRYFNPGESVSSLTYVYPEN